MILIFTASTDMMSNRRTSRFLAPLLRWLVPSISPETIHNAQIAIRKTGHLVEYAIMAVLFFIALRGAQRGWDGFSGNPGSTPSGRKSRWAVGAFLLALAYAASDEFHQSFVPTRQGSLMDVGIDGLGAAAGLFVLHRVGRWRTWW